MNVPASTPEFDLREEGPTSTLGDAALPDYPFEQNLQQKQLGVGEFANALVYFLNGIQGSLVSAYHAVRMGLTGRIPCEKEGDEPADDEEAPEEDDNTVFDQIRIDTTMDRGAPYDDEELLVAGDIDSILAFSSNLGVSTAIHVSPFPDYSRTVKKDIHHSFLIGNNFVPAHRVPNFNMASWGHRGQINIFLPNMYDANVLDRRIRPEMQEYIYNHLIYPSHRAALEGHHTHLHTTFRAAFTNQRDVNTNRVHRTSIDIPGHLVEFFGQQFYRLAEESPHRELHAPIFMMQARGTKAVYSYVHGDPGERENVINEVRALFTPVMFVQGQATILVDLGTEISLPGHTLRVRREAHPDVLRWAIPNLTPARAEGITRLRSYYMDPSAQLYDLCGSRWAPQLGVADYHGLRYFQIYFTDKTFSYSLDFANIFSSRLAMSTLPKNIEKLSDQLANICNQIADLKDNPGTLVDNRENRQDGAVRIEVRININDIDSYARDLPVESIRPWIVPYRSVVWWTFIYGRVRVIKVAVDMIMQAKLVKRGMPGALQLSAALVVMLNAIFSRESTKPAEKALLEASGRRHRKPDEGNAENFADGSEYVGHDSGLYFLADIVLGGEHILPADRVPRLPNASVDTFGQDALPGLFHERTFRDLVAHFDPQQAEGRVNPMRVANRRNTRHRAVEDVQAGMPEPPRAGIVIPNTVHFRPPPRITEVDPGFHPNTNAQEDTEDRTGYVDAETANPREVLETLIRQFVLDIFAKAPNHVSANEPSHLLLDRDAREAVTVEVLRTLDLSRFFQSVWVLYATPKQWENCFKHAFPAPGQLGSAKTQNYKTCKYRNDWIALMTQLGDDAPACRTALRSVFDTFMWIPAFISDRMWQVKSTPPAGDTQRYPAGTTGATVWITINPRFKDQAKRGKVGL